MHMSFWWDWNFGDFLINEISITSVTSMVVACICMIILSIAFEGLKSLETKMHIESDDKIGQTAGRYSDERNNLLNSGGTRISIAGPSSQTLPPVIVGSFSNKKYVKKFLNMFLFFTNTSIKYMLMLIIMRYNGYLVVSIIFGALIGYFIFGYISFKCNLEHFVQKKKFTVICTTDCEENENGTTPPLMQGEGSSQSNIQTCEFEIHSCERSCPSASEDINILVVEEENDENLSKNISVESEKDHSTIKEINSHKNDEETC